jgi:hypothetical protein
MTDLTHLIGRTLSYETAAFPFHGLFLACANQCLDDGGATLSDLSELNLHVDEQSVGSLYREFYSAMDRAPFLSCYRRLIEDVVSPLFGESFRFQRKPGIRIHLPNVLTVQFHADEWYGPGPDVVNFWMPLTDAFDSNTLVVASLADSLREVGRLESEKATMETINGDLAKIVKPLQSGLGRLHIFNARCVHGSLPNQTGQTRVSIDFRILPKDADPGLKPIDEYYSSLTDVSATDACGGTRDVGHRACSYLFGAHGFTRHVGTTNQRLICAEFAKQHGITILAAAA